MRSSSGLLVRCSGRPTRVEIFRRIKQHIKDVGRAVFLQELEQLSDTEYECVTSELSHMLNRAWMTE